MKSVRVLVVSLAVFVCASTAGAQTTNLALNRPVAASSSSGTGFGASLAVDGNGGTRWSSAFTDNEWWYVDLGATYNISRIVINWEAAYAKTYDLQVSQNATTWTTFFSGTNAFPTNGQGSSTVTTPATGRYVRFVGKTRAVVWGGQWGYSFWEFQVFGTVVAPPGAVTALTPADGTLGAPLLQSLSWGAAAGATGYDVAFGTTNPPSTVSANQAGTTYSPGALLYGTTYYWRVTAQNAAGSTASSVARFTTLAQPALSTIRIAPATATAVVGGTQPFTATTLDQYGNPISAPVTWSSSAPAVASINAASGVATAIAAGTTTVTASSGSIKGTATLAVNAPPVLTTIVVSPATPSIAQGSNQTFTAQGLDQHGQPIAAALTWTSSATAVGTINANTGAFSALSPGTTTITAASGSVTGGTTATVTPPAVLTTITISPSNPTVVAGATLAFAANGFDQQAKPITATYTWSSSNTAAGTVNASSGLFTALVPGTTTITATSGTVHATTTVTVAARVLTSITVSPSSPGVSQGSTQTFTAQGFDQADQPFAATVTWSSSTLSVGTINASTGTFTALAVGSTTITATSGSVSGSTSVTVTAPPPVLTSIVVSPASASILAGSSTTFTAQGRDQAGAPMSAAISWSAAPSSVGTINASSGTFTATAAGTATVTATSGSITGTATVTVTPRHNTNLKRLRITSWNVAQGYTGAGQLDHQSQIDLLASTNPDVVVLSEVSLADDDMVTEFISGMTSRTGKPWVGSFHPAIPGASASNSIGDMIMTWLPVDTQTSLPYCVIPNDPAPPVNTSCVTFEHLGVTINNVPLDIASVHLNWFSSDDRAAQLQQLTSWIGTYGANQLLIGDFNAEPDDPLWTAAFKASFQDVWANVVGTTGDIGITMDHRTVTNAPGRIDYHFIPAASAHVAVQQFAVVKTPLSDHHLLFGDYIITP